MSRLGQTVKVKGGGGAVGYSSVWKLNEHPAGEPMAITIPAGGLAIIGWSFRSQGDGDTDLHVTVTTVSGTSTAGSFSSSKALTGFYSASGGGFIYSSGGGVYSLALSGGGNVTDAVLWAIVVTDGGHFTYVGS